MRKDCGIAASLVSEQTPDATLIPEVFRLVQAAEVEVGGRADYTEVARYLERRGAVQTGRTLELHSTS